MKKYFFTSIFVLWSLLVLPTLAQAQCSAGESQMIITLHTDANPSETALEIHDLSNQSTLFAISGSTLGANSTHMFPLCVPSGSCLKADLYDSAGNGGPHFSIDYQGTTYTSSPGGLFGHISTALMGSITCTDISPVLDSGAYFIQSAGKISIGDGNQFYGSILGNPSNGEVCMGIRNQVNGWIAGDKIALGANNTITGYNNIQLFAKDYGPGCHPTNGLPGHDLHLTHGPYGDVSDACDPNAPIVASNNDIILDGENASTSLFASAYGTVSLTNGASLEYFGHPDPNVEGPFYYTIEELIIDNASFRAGGGVLCDIFINADKVTIMDDADVQAIINCDEYEMGHNNSFIGEITMKDPAEELKIGNSNMFKDPICPACVNSNKKSKSGTGSIEPLPKMKIWPNPSDKGEVNISAPAGDLEVYDLTGTKVYAAEIAAPASGNTQQQVIPTENLLPGMYISRVITTDGRILNSKFLLLGS